MDKRMFSLLLCSYISVVGFLLSLTTLYFRAEVFLGIATLAEVFLGIATLFVGIFGIFIVLGLGALFSILAIADAVSKQQVMDERYFTRCFIYRVAFLLWPLLIGFVLFRMVQTGDPDHGGDAMWPIIPALAASLALNVTTSLHVISGLAACRKQKTITGGEFASHVVMQLCCGFDFISSLILMFKEWKDHPNERVGFFRHVFVKRTLPIPGFFGVLLGVCVLSSWGILSSFFSVGVQTFMLYTAIGSSADFSWKIGRLEESSFFFFLFLFALIVCVIFDAARFYRKLPVDLISRPFLNKVIAYSSVALLLQISLFSLLFMFVGSLITHDSLITSINKIAVIKAYYFYLAITVAAIVSVQVSVALYTRLSIKRSLTDGVISDEKAELFNRMSLIPGAQIATVYRLFKAIRDHEEAVEPALGSRFK